MENKNFIIGVDHIGIAVPDIDEAQKLYETLGYSAVGSKIGEVDYGVNTLMMKLGSQTIELLEPLNKGEESPIDRYIASKPYTMYHVAYKVSDFEEQINILQENRYVMIGEPRVSKSAGGKRAVFMFNRKLGIVELLES